MSHTVERDLKHDIGASILCVSTQLCFNDLTHISRQCALLCYNELTTYSSPVCYVLNSSSKGLLYLFIPWNGRVFNIGNTLLGLSNILQFVENLNFVFNGQVRPVRPGRHGEGEVNPHNPSTLSIRVSGQNVCLSSICVSTHKIYLWDPFPKWRVLYLLDLLVNL